MADARNLFPSKWLKAADFTDGPAVMTMTGLKMEQFDNRQTREKEDKPVLYFAETDKGLVLNKTNTDRIGAHYGYDYQADWPGKKIQLYMTEVESFGETVDAIRVRTPKNEAAPPVDDPPPPGNDDIPF